MRGIYIVVLLSVFVCCDFVSSVVVVNYSDKNYVVYYSFDDSLKSSGDSLNYDYYKSFDENKLAITDEPNDYYVRGKDFGRLSFLAKDPGGLFRRSPDGKVRFFFVRDSVFFNNPWDTIVKYQMYDKKYTYSAAVMDSLDWMVEVR